MIHLTAVHLCMTDRYEFDFKLCPVSKGWAQIDTGQDASYFGTWANPFKLQIVSYAEGDVCYKTCDTEMEFINEIREIKAWNEETGNRFIGIDPGLIEENKTKWSELGLADLLH